VDGTTVYWLEARPGDEGRVTLVRRDDDGPRDVSLPGQNVRTRFHEYGNGAYSVRDGVVLFVDFGDQRVWRAAPDEEPRPITSASDGRVRYAGFAIDAFRAVAFCLREDQRDPDVEPVTSLVRLDLLGPNADHGTTLVAGRERPREVAEELAADVDSPPDFVLDPVLSPDGRSLAWVSWNHPNMAWDGTWLRVGRLDEAGDLHDLRLVAGSEQEAIEQPVWLDDDRLAFLSDRTGWSNHYVADLATPSTDVQPLHRDEHEYGQPRWTPGQSSYGVLPDGRLVTTRYADGYAALCVLAPDTGETSPVNADLTFVHEVRTRGAGQVVCRALFADRPAALVTVEVETGSITPVVDDPADPEPGLGSRPEPVDWPTADGATAHGFFYPPVNPLATADPGELPPLVVTLHGGPTAAAIPEYTLKRTFWTSRGFAVLDVNYAGSTGFGRAYRQRLDGAWGVAEVADVAAGARHLAAEGRVDGTRAVITGGSAGGFTTLAALAFTDVFAAGASHFGVGDLAALARDTHKLESRYLWRLVAPWPEGKDVYEERSPLRHVDRISAPLILLQGTDDRVVPPAQAEEMAAAVRGKGLPMALVMFEGEGHGFRSLDNQARALECELSFYAQVFGFDLPDQFPPVVIENLRAP
jgi:dipeptidyl aminopeptidase/acylaminoacyl peptidase